jgi:hypothetical protein
VPYDPFKVDIFTVGNVLRRDFVDVRSGFFQLIIVFTCFQNYSNLGFFIPLIKTMTQSDPNRRPSAEHALQQWRTIQGRINFLHRFWRLRHHSEPILYAPFLDIIYALVSMPRFARLLGRGLRRMLARIHSYACPDSTPLTIP